MAIGPVPLPQIVERRADVHDVPAILRLISHWADQKQMLPKSLHQIFRTVQDFWVAEDAGEIVGCGALRVYTETLAEICSLAIAPGQQGRGIGQGLVRRIAGEAKRLGLAQVFALTYQVGFFERLGFRVIDMETLPHKIWRDCVHCPFLDNCNETALILDV